ncbi:MAG: DUF4440 domain-containing protein [Pseudomonadota bacterium]
MIVSEALATKLRELENRLLQPSVREDAQTAGELLAPEFMEIGQSGKVYDKTQVLEAMKAEPLTEGLVAEEFAARQLAADIVLVTYRCKATLRSSIWRKTAGRWQLVFHQGTPCT